MINNFADCVETVVEVQQSESLEEAKIVLITDAAGLDKTDVQRGLGIMDAHNGEVWGKLDAGTEAYYNTVNRSSVKFERIQNNLLETAKARPIIIQSLFLKVHGQTMDAPELGAYCGRLNALTTGGAQISEAHMYTVARPTPEAYAEKLEAEVLEDMADQVRKETGLEVVVFP